MKSLAIALLLLLAALSPPSADAAQEPAANANPPAASPPPPQPGLTSNPCFGKGWCYITVYPDGRQEASGNPPMDISWPPTSTAPRPRLVIVNIP